jgi:N-dimethylarginine dimethylaminohydrolase
MPLINSTVLMSDARHFSALKAINPYYGDKNVDLHQADMEHRFITQALSLAGITIAAVPSPIDSQDGVYTANWALVRGDVAILARLPDVRKAEEAYAKQVLEQLGKKVIEVPKNMRFSIQLQTVPELDKNGEPVINAVSGWPDSFFYDIDLALSIIKAPVAKKSKGLIAYCPEAFTPESQKILASFDRVDKIEVSLEEATEAFACNLVSTGETVIMSAHAPKLKAELEARGMKVLTPEVHELAKGGGYIRCTTLSLEFQFLQCRSGHFRFIPRVRAVSPFDCQLMTFSK